MHHARDVERYFGKQEITHDILHAQNQAEQDLPDEQADGGWAIRTYVKPFANWIWAGCIVMGIGGILSLTDRRYRVAAGARKRYAGLVEEGGERRVVFTGLEAVRRDWTALARRTPGNKKGPIPGPFPHDKDVSGAAAACDANQPDQAGAEHPDGGGNSHHGCPKSKVRTAIR